MKNPCIQTNVVERPKFGGRPSYAQMLMATIAGMTDDEVLKSIKLDDAVDSRIIDCNFYARKCKAQRSGSNQYTVC